MVAASAVVAQWNWTRTASASSFSFLTRNSAWRKGFAALMREKPDELIRLMTASFLSLTLTIL